MGTARTFGRKPKANSPPAQIYRDDPPRDDSESVSALSLHSNIGESSSTAAYQDLLEDGDTQEDLPPYTDADVSEAAPISQERAGPISLDMTDVQEFEHSDKKGSRRFILSNTFTSDPAALEVAIRNQLWIPPRTYMSIHGEHTEKRQNPQNNNKTETHTIVDFDLKVDLSELHRSDPLRLEQEHDDSTTPEVSQSLQRWSYLKTASNSFKTYRGGVMKSTNKQPVRRRRDVENTEDTEEHVPGLTEWVHRFCASHYSLKSFEVRHRVVDRDDSLLQSRVEEYVRATNYRGRISISFGTSPRTQTYQTRHRLNLARHNRWIWWACVLLQLWIITWPILFFTNKRWAVADIVWPTRRLVPMPKTHPEYEPERQQQVYRTKSEGAWAEYWRYTIQTAILNKQTGGQVLPFAGSGVEEARARAERDAENAARRGSEPQGGVVGGMLSLVRGISNMSRERNDARGWGYDE